MSTFISFTTTRTSPDATGQHGLGHKAVVVDIPVLECECDYSHFDTISSGREQGGASSSIAASACREGGQVDFIVSVRGLVQGFTYELEIIWFLLDNDRLTHMWKSIVTAETDAYELREPLLRRNYDDFHFGMMAWDAYNKSRDRFLIDVTVFDMYPALTSQEALIGSRNIDSSLTTLRLKCTAQTPGEADSDAGTPALLVQKNLL